MGKRTNFSDIAAMALLFNYDANSLTTMISYEKVNKFDEIINQNLDEMNSKISSPLFIEDDSELYFRATDEDGKTYLVISPNADIESARSYHIGTLPIDIILAAEKDNALATIGLKLIDGKLKKI